MVKIGGTICGADALNNLVRLMESIKDLNGDVAEVGVYKGGSALLISRTLINDRIFLFDTFEGMPESNENDNYHKKGDFNDTSYEEVVKLFSENKNIFVYKGCFPRENSEIISDKKFKLVHLDVDIYDSYKECLDFFYDKMVTGGIMVFDDYSASSCLGAKKAVDEFIIKHNLVLHKGGDSQYYITL
jgi:O-methyltransferase